MRMLGRLLTRKGEAEEAVPVLRDVLEHYRTHFGDEYLLTVRARFYLGDALRATGALDEAEPLLLGSYRDLRERYGALSDEARNVAESLAGLYRTSERPREAARFGTLARPGA
jgi:hypothetical protein